jgi:DNA invertase Pin-like site-specific DNA recombinase
MKVIAYYRVSTKKQGESGLGLEAQKNTINRFLASSPYELVSEYVEIESGRKTDKRRPQLRAALEQCEREGATLMIAKLDRLTRNVGFLTTLLDRQVPIMALDMPNLQDPAMSRFILQLMANVAELERAQISDRTKKALAARKARGMTLGSPTPANGAQAGGLVTADQANEFASQVYPVIQELKKFGCATLAKIAQGLSARGIATATGKKAWSISAVRNVVNRAEGAIA